MLRPSQAVRLVRSSRRGTTSIVGQQHLRTASVVRRSTSSLLTPSSSLISESTTTDIRQRDESLQHYQRRLFHSTPPYCQSAGEEESKKEAATPDELPPPPPQDDDPCPEWQNPLHHNNPDYNKHFAEDFEDGEMVPLPLPPFEEEPGKTLAPPHIHDLAHRIVHLTLLEMKELTTKIADHFGFDDDMMAANYAAGAGGGMAAGGAGAAAKEEPKEEKTIFELKLNGFDAKAKIKVIKEVRAITGLGLKEAKEMVESAPKVVQKDLKKDKAEELKAQLEAIGAEVEIV